jgi:hypothetical protein
MSRASTLLLPDCLGRPEPVHVAIPVTDDFRRGLLYAVPLSVALWAMIISAAVWALV